MKKILVILGLITLIGFGSSDALAQLQQQSQLPPCATGSVWNQCFGTKNYPNGDKYVGEWVGGKASGQGTYTSKASAAMYSGQFAADTFSGAGTMTWTNGAKFIGQWKNDSAVSGTITYANGTTAVGTIRNAVFYASAQQPQAAVTQSSSPTQGKLPPCQGHRSTWNMCFGTYSDAGNSYVGEWKNGDFHGQGILSAADGSSQTGEFKDGIFQKGDYKQPDPRIAAMNQASVAQQQPASQQQTPPSKLPACQSTDSSKWNMCFGTWSGIGDSYIGEWKSGKYHGQGKLNTASGRVQAGEFKDGEYIARQTVAGMRSLLTNRKRNLPPCQGIEFRNFDMCFGSFTFPDGLKYSGEWEKGTANGQGVLMLRDGGQSEGTFADGQLNGQGVFIAADQKITIVGEFKDGKGNGNTTVTTALGEYVGQSKDSMSHGEGVFTSTNGDVIAGEFSNGQPHGQVSVSDRTGGKYVGEMKEGLMDGFGNLTFPDGTQYSGEFTDDKYNGKGTLVTAKGEKFVGEFLNGEYVGTQLTHEGKVTRENIRVLKTAELTPRYRERNGISQEVDIKIHDFILKKFGSHTLDKSSDRYVRHITNVAIIDSYIYGHKKYGDRPYYIYLINSYVEHLNSAGTPQKAIISYEFRLDAIMAKDGNLEYEWTEKAK